MVEAMAMSMLPRRSGIGIAFAFLALAGCLSGHAQSAPPNGVQATSTPVLRPHGVAYDASGNYYIADTDQNVIRKVNTAGTITTVAGTGGQGYAGDGGPATAALLDSPGGVAVDSTGNIYIADTHNNAIREVSASTGDISTIAGTGVAGYSGDSSTATAAMLSNPTAVAADSNGNVYVADTNNHRIRKIIGTTIYTVAGNGEQGYGGDTGPATAASLDSPNGVAVDAAFNIYIGDTHNQLVRMVTWATGHISTLAGTGVKGYNGEGTATAVELARPRGVAVDSSNHVYVADSDNELIRSISGGNVNTIAGNGRQGFSGDGSAATAASLDTPDAVGVSGTILLFSDTGNAVVRKLNSGIINSTAGQSPDAPTAVSVSPSLGFGITQQFSFAASSPIGAGNLAIVKMLFNTTLNRVNGCYLTYLAAGNQLLLLSDDGTTSTAGQPSTTGTLSNSQCSVDLSATTVTPSGDTLNVAPTITFKSGFAAGIQTYMYVQDIPGMNSGWKTMGWWMVGSVPESAPSAVSVSPSSGFGTTQQFSFVASSPNGAGNLAVVKMLFNTTLSRVNGCYLTYVAAGNQLSLLSDDGTTSTSGVPGTTGTISNSQCSVDLSATTVTASGNTLTVAPAITFKSRFTAGIQTYMYVQDLLGMNSGWKTMGQWMVGSLAEQPPSAVSVSPSSGFGTTQQFSFVASSPNGAGNLAEVKMLFNTMLYRVNGCYLTYLAAGNQLSLVSDDGTTSTSGQPGTTGTLSNSQCSVNLSATTVTASGNTLTLAPTITFKSGFKAGIQTYMYVEDILGENSGWQTMGWWMVGSMAEQPPTAVSVSPSSGFGTTQQFSFVASSKNGAGNVAVVKVLFNTALQWPNSCDLSYTAAGNQLSLLSDEADYWITGQPGATGTLSNSQCSVDMSATTVTASGNTLTIAPTITFTPAFRPGIHIYMYAADVPGMNSGWKKMSP